MKLFINIWYERVEELREIGYQRNEFLDKILYKECIQDVEYNPILSVIDMMYIPSIIDQVKAKIMKWGDKMKHKNISWRS